MAQLKTHGAVAKWETQETEETRDIHLLLVKWLFTPQYGKLFFRYEETSYATPGLARRN